MVLSLRFAISFTFVLATIFKFFPFFIGFFLSFLHFQTYPSSLLSFLFSLLLYHYCSFFFILHHSFSPFLSLSHLLSLSLLSTVLLSNTPTLSHLPPTFSYLPPCPSVLPYLLHYGFPASQSSFYSFSLYSLFSTPFL